MAPGRERGLHELVRFVGPSIALGPVLVLAISILIARTLGPEGRGAYGLAVTTIAALPLVFGFGFDLAIRYWSARGEVDPRSLLRTVTLLGLLMGGVLAAIGGVLVLRRSPAWLVPGTIGALGAAGLCIALGLSPLKAYWSNYLSGQERYGYSSWGNNLSVVVQLVVLATWWRLSGVSLDAALIAFAAQLVCSLLLFFAFAGRDFARSLRAPLLRSPDLGQMVRYGSWEWLGELLAQTNLRLNIFLLAALSGHYETGLYTAVLGPANFLLLLASPLGLVLSARTARRSDDLDFPHRVAGALRLVFVISAVPALIGAALALPVLPWVFGEDFLGSVRPFQLLLPGVIFLSLIRLVAQYQAGVRRPDWNARVAAVGAVLAVGLNVLLIPRYGASGAAAATSLANLGALLVSLIAFLRVSGLALRDVLAFRSSDWTPLGRVLGIGRNPV